MKRFHMHLAVTDLAANIAFYSRMFGAAPTVEKQDYAKWMLDDPRINFAISSRGHAAGLEHVGIQVESSAELEEVKQMYMAADQAKVVAETGAACCYAQSDKYWLQDPQGIAWEAFHTLGEIPTFNAPAAKPDEAALCDTSTGCCAPPTQTVSSEANPNSAMNRFRGKPINIPIKG